MGTTTGFLDNLGQISSVLPAADKGPRGLPKALQQTLL